MREKIKGEKALTGFSGECYVMAELLRQGVIAGLSPRNAMAFDILAINNDKNVKIRVKTRKTGNWRWSVARGTIFPELSNVGDFTVLVDLTKRNLDEMFFIIKTVEINNWLKISHNNFLHRGGKDNPIRSLSPKEKELTSYRNWNILWD